MPLYKYIAKLSGQSGDTFKLPVPAFNVINGGCHAGNNLAFQEFMILPTAAGTFTEAMRIGSEVYHHLKAAIKAKYGPDAVNVGDEGGFAPNISGAKEGLDLLVEAISKAGYSGKVKIAMDVAASEFYTNGAYDLDFKRAGAQKAPLSGAALAELYQSFCRDYPSSVFIFT